MALKGPFPLGDYQIGWISALSIEQTAALALLDEEYEPSDTPPSDENIYFFGRIHRHKVVLACLPFGITGKATTATLASNMQRTFTSMRFGIMVGIGGGVWSPETDVRLGDIVVGASEDGKSGIVQYDHGKTLQDQEFAPKGSMNKAPSALLKAVSALRARHGMGRRLYPEYVKAVSIMEASELQTLASRPAPSSDRLYSNEYVHLKDSICSTHPDSAVIPRPPRTQNQSKVHYGKIASGDQVMKDAKVREKIREDHDIICFEMEMAGLDSFPCLAIRGISDYADSHKNDDWHPYAAVMAAAYAKELLDIIQPSGVSALPRASQMTEIDRAGIISHKGSRVPETCEWIREHQQYMEWFSGDNPLLWISGGPGKGKTMMSIYLTEVLEKLIAKNPGEIVIYFFCDHQVAQRNSATSILRGLIWQLRTQFRPLLEHAYPYFNGAERSESSRDSPEALWIIFEKMYRDARNKNVYCVLDGIDECDENSRLWIIAKLRSISLPEHKSSSSGRFHVIVVSRDIPRLRGCAQIRLDPDEDTQVGRDVDLFISAKLDTISRQIGPEFATIRQHVKNGISEKAKGTFLWIGFIMSDLSRKGTCTEIVAAMRNLPKDLEGIYARILLEVKQEHREVVASILNWITMAVKPLSIMDFEKTLARNPPLGIDAELFAKDQLRYCSQMVSIHDDGTVGLVHQSAWDYLVRDKPDEDATLEFFRIQPEKAHLEVAQSLIKHLTTQPCEYMSYAEQYWWQHARYAGYLAQSLLSSAKPLLDNSSGISRKLFIAQQLGIECPRPLVVASFLGILPWVRTLVPGTRLHAQLDIEDEDGDTALIYAASMPNTKILRLLLDQRNVNANHQNYSGQTASHMAVRWGNTANIKLLLDQENINSNLKDANGYTAFDLAVRKRDHKMASLLITKQNIGVESGVVAIKTGANHPSRNTLFEPQTVWRAPFSRPKPKLPRWRYRDTTWTLPPARFDVHPSILRLENYDNSDNDLEEITRP